MATAKKTATKKAAPTADKGLTPIKEIALGAKQRTSKRHGPKDKLYALLQRKGSTKFGALLVAAEKEGLPASKVRKWVPSWEKKGYITIA